MIKTETLHLECGHLREMKGFVLTQYKRRKRAYCIKCGRNKPITRVEK